MGRARALWTAVLAAALAGCPPKDPAGSGARDADADAGTDAGAGTGAGAGTDAGAGAGAAADEEKPGPERLELLKMTLTSDVKDKEPVDRLDAAKAGEKVYAHLAIRNRTGEPREVRVEFQVNGKTRTELTLKVGESWQWRTWGYNTLREADAGGELLVTVTEVGGAELAQRTVPIRKGGGS